MFKRESLVGRAHGRVSLGDSATFSRIPSINCRSAGQFDRIAERIDVRHQSSPTVASTRFHPVVDLNDRAAQIRNHESTEVLLDASKDVAKPTIGSSPTRGSHADEVLGQHVAVA